MIHRHSIKWPQEDRVVATIDDLYINGASPRSLTDPDFELTIDEVLECVRMQRGEYVRNKDGTAATAQAVRRTTWRHRKFLVQQVSYEGYLLFVVWGWPSEIERYLGCRIKLRKEFHQICLPFVLGWQEAGTLRV